MRAKEFVPASKPRNFVAKNQKTAGAGAHKDKKRAEKQGDVKHKKNQIPMEGLREFAPVGSDGGTPPRGPKTPGKDPWGGNDGPGDDPYSRPEPEYYSRSIDFFGKFEADHFDDEEFDKKTGVFKGYWDDEEGRVQIAYFKFDDPKQAAKDFDDSPGMGWYYEPQNEDMEEDSETPDRETHLVRKLGRLGERVVQNPKLWNKYSEAVDNDDNNWIISLIQEGTGADKTEVMELAELFGEIGGGTGRIIDFAWAVKEGTWEEDFLKPYLEHKKKNMSERVRDPEDWDEGNTEPGNNFAIYINGKKWKVFPGPYGAYADSPEEEREFYRLKDMARRKSEATGKKWEVSKTGEPATK